MAWTAPRTWTTGELVSAALLNTHVRDNLSYVKGLFDLATGHSHDGATADAGPQIGTDGIADGAVTPVKILNRTRRFFVPADASYNIITGATLDREDLHGYRLPDNADCISFGNFCVPADYVSDLTVTGLAYNQVATGNGYLMSRLYAGANGEGAAQHYTEQDFQAISLQGARWTEVQPLTLADASVGDYVCVDMRRNGSSPSDTIAGTVCCAGWLVTYTADS